MIWIHFFYTKNYSKVLHLNTILCYKNIVIFYFSSFFYLFLSLKKKAFRLPKFSRINYIFILNNQFLLQFLLIIWNILKVWYIVYHNLRIFQTCGIFMEEILKFYSISIDNTHHKLPLLKYLSVLRSLFKFRSLEFISLGFVNSLCR